MKKTLCFIGLVALVLFALAPIASADTIIIVDSDSAAYSLVNQRFEASEIPPPIFPSAGVPGTQLPNFFGPFFDKGYWNCSDVAVGKDGITMEEALSLTQGKGGVKSASVPYREEPPVDEITQIVWFKNGDDLNTYIADNGLTPVAAIKTHGKFKNTSDQTFGQGCVDAMTMGGPILLVINNGFGTKVRSSALNVGLSTNGGGSVSGSVQGGNITGGIGYNKGKTGPEGMPFLQGVACKNGGKTLPAPKGLKKPTAPAGASEKAIEGSQ
jgi:hypothetical protein